MAEWEQKANGLYERTVDGELWQLEWTPTRNLRDGDPGEGWYLYGPTCESGDWMGDLYDWSEANANEQIIAWQEARGGGRRG